LHRAGEFIVGVVIGFLGGMFGTGGSAVATPLLNMLGVPGFLAVASPLPAVIPGMAIASTKYWKSHLLDWEIFLWSAGVGIPAIVLGSYLTKYTGARPLLIATGLLVLGFGVSFIFLPRERGLSKAKLDVECESTRPPFWRIRLFLVAAGVGLVAGLLAIGGGFFFAPSYCRFLGLPIKKAFANSLPVSIALAIPGTVIHAYMGHVSWTIAGLLALGSVPFSYLGAWVAINTQAARLERIYGAALTILGVFFLTRL
jgi:uncharacterized membrane protein YfcA